MPSPFIDLTAPQDIPTRPDRLSVRPDEVQAIQGDVTIDGYTITLTMRDGAEVCAVVLPSGMDEYHRVLASFKEQLAGSNDSPGGGRWPSGGN